MANVWRAAAIIATYIALNCAWPATTQAFPTADAFLRDAKEGGAGGLMFTGGPRALGYDCGICHLGDTTELAIALNSEPPGLFGSDGYAPGQSYKIMVQLTDEELGVGAAANLNAFAVELDSNSPEVLAGVEASPDGGCSLVDDNRVLFGEGYNGRTEWSFVWHAPQTSTGHLDLYFAAIDGNGANSTSQILNDIAHDAVATRAVRVGHHKKRPPPLKLPDLSSPDATERDVIRGCGVDRGVPGLVSMFVAMLLGPWLRRRSAGD